MRFKKRYNIKHAYTERKDKFGVDILEDDIVNGCYVICPCCVEHLVILE